MGTPASVFASVLLLSLPLSLAIGCGGGDGFGGPSNEPFPARIEATVNFSGGVGQGTVTLRSASDSPLLGATIHLLDGRDSWRMTEYPPGSGTYRLGTGTLPHRGRYAIDVDLPGVGQFRSEAVAAPERHEILSPEPFGTYDAGAGLDVVWTAGGTADAARITLSRNDRSVSDSDDGQYRFSSGQLDESTYDERIEVMRYRESGLPDTLPGSYLRVEARESVSPFAVLQ